MGESKKERAPRQERSFNNIRIAREFPRSKGNNFLDQRIRIIKAWRSGPPKTMLEISAITGIERASICWFAREFRLNNSIRLVSTGICSISKHRAGRYSMNPKYWNHTKKEVQDV